MIMCQYNNINVNENSILNVMFVIVMKMKILMKYVWEVMKCAGECRKVM